MITTQVPGIYSLVHSISVDEENKRRLESEIAECRTAQTVVEEEIKKLEGEMRQVEDRWNNLQKQREDIEARKKAVNEANKQMESLKLRLGEVPSNDYTQVYPLNRLNFISSTFTRNAPKRTKRSKCRKS